MPYQVNGLIDTLKAHGLIVEVVPGWETRGDPSFNPKGLVAHHTAGPATGIRPSLSIVTKGRSDLKGPLCNFFLDRNGVVVIVAAGRANHAGTGGYKGLVGNSSVWGVEAESTGVEPRPWTDAQLWAYPRLVAAALQYSKRDASWVTNHKVWAPTRKVDCVSLSNEWFQSETTKVWNGDEDLTPQESKALFFIAEQLGGAGWADGKFGWTQLDGKTIVDALAETRATVQRELAGVLPNRVDGKTKDTVFGYALNSDANSFKANTKLDQLIALVSKLTK